VSALGYKHSPRFACDRALSLAARSKHAAPLADAAAASIIAAPRPCALAPQRNLSKVCDQKVLCICAAVWSTIAADQTRPRKRRVASDQASLTRACTHKRSMSAFGGKADIAKFALPYSLLTQSGH